MNDTMENTMKTLPTKTEILNEVYDMLDKVKDFSPRFVMSHPEKTYGQLQVILGNLWDSDPQKLWDWERVFWDEIQPVFGLSTFRIEGQPAPKPIEERETPDKSCVYVMPEFLTARIYAKAVAFRHSKVLKDFCNNMWRNLNYEALIQAFEK